ncbi:MAG: hypothetical protein COV66_04185 [Nitrospinae bacterium CG11_big_fil_rev_8_21_14_0_20_45_15]|nr:MAG: hypothetical protein COV66_04185 [Nitrospinae bacterium CG11_big_fil_rev_8_21_14_0_20_45_15]
MGWWWGVGLGFLRGGPLGALFGGAAQHLLSKAFAKRLDKMLPGLENREIFVASLVAIIFRVVNGAGSAEIRVVKQFFTKNLNYSSDDLSFVDEISKKVRSVRPDLAPIVADYKKASNNLYLSLPLALSYQTAIMGNRLDDDAQKLIFELSQLLGVSYETHDKIRKKYSLSVLKTPYSILEVPSTVSDEDLKIAYRKMVARFHPDRAQHDTGLSPELGHAKFLEIQKAYETLEKLRGLK